MIRYSRPVVHEPIFRDAQGNVIEYGSRWGGNPPPEETYSVAIDLERFRPVHAVADALIKHLADNYEVEVMDDLAVASDFPRSHMIRAVRLLPATPSAAPLTFIFTAFPGIVLRAGVLHEERFPSCGCEACDETWTSAADRLEFQVLAVAEGHFREGIDGWPSTWFWYSFETSEGASSSTSRARDIPGKRRRQARRILSDLPNGWAAWPKCVAVP